MDENTYSIVLRDHESDYLVFIAEVRTQWDIERIKSTRDQLYRECEDDNQERIDFYEELANRTWLNIYRADVLDI